MDTPSKSTRVALWSSIDRCASLFESHADEFGIADSPILRSRVYLGQYAPLHRAVDLVVDRYRSRGINPVILDWGAGYGHFAATRALRGDRVRCHSLLDPDAAIYRTTLAAVTSHLGIPLDESADPVGIDLPTGSLDVVVSVGVLEHVHEGGGDAAASLSEIRRVLRPGGTFVCGHLPSRTSMIEFANRRLGRSHHDRTFSKAEISSLLFDAGFVVSSHRWYGALPRNSLAGFAMRSGRDSLRHSRHASFADLVLSTVVGRVSQNQLVVAVSDREGI